MDNHDDEERRRAWDRIAPGYDRTEHADADVAGE